MPKLISFKKGLLSILFWSIISAAFIGPGTVTTASKAGATYGTALIWAIVFSIIATIILQEAAARITIASGKNLGEFIASKYKSGKTILWAIFLSVAFGCAAYEAGNILGAIAGLELFTEVPSILFVVIIAIICSAFLWIGNYKLIASILGFVVAVMGIVFIVAAFNTNIDFGNILSDSFVPEFPTGSSLLILALIGTTIVPYNLFLASGISKGQEIHEMRFGITIAVVIGGLISIAILLVGTQVVGDFSFENLGATLAQNSGSGMQVFFGVGLFAAGLSSAITAPLAAAITAQSLLGAGNTNWGPKSNNFRYVWAVVLLIGLFFGATQIKPIPVIILAQAINGFLLPLIAIFLLFAVNDRKLLSQEYINSIWSNVLMLIIVWAAIFLGLNNLFTVFQKVAPDLVTGEAIIIKLILSFSVVMYCGWKIFRSYRE